MRLCEYVNGKCTRAVSVLWGRYCCAGRLTAAVSTLSSAAKSVFTAATDWVSMMLDIDCCTSASRSCRLLAPRAICCCCCWCLLLGSNNVAIPAPWDDDDASLHSATWLPQLFFTSDDEAEEWCWLSDGIFGASFSPLRIRLYRSSWHSWLSGNLAQQNCKLDY